MMGQMNPQDDNNWRTHAFRQNVVAKIEENIKNSGASLTRSSVEMENQVFVKAATKDEYLGYVARLILHVRDFNANKKMSGQSDPMNALRIMAQPVPGNQMMNMQQQGGPQNPATNLLQTLNQSRPNLQNTMPGMSVSMMNQMGNTISMQPGSMQPGSMQPGSMQPGSMHPGSMGQVNISMSNQMNATVNPSVASVNMQGAGPRMNVNAMGQMINAGTMQNQMNMSNQIPNNMGGPMLPMSSVLNNQMSGGQMSSNMASGIPHNQMAVHLSQRKVVPEAIMVQGQNGISYIPNRSSVSSPMFRQGTPPLNQQPVQMNAIGSMIPSPLVPAPSPTPLPPNAGGLAPILRPGGPNMAASPSSGVTLNTPGGQSQPTPSPLGNEEQAYRDKVKELSRYIEPLRKMISRLGQGDHEKMLKMKKLLEILTTPGQRITMDTLLKCEAVLEKLDMAEVKEQHPLIEAISAAIQSPNVNHTFQRTFEPVMATLNGKPLKTLPKPLKRKQVQENVVDIPEVLQGEVARLDPRFKVSLDPVQQNSSKCVHLLCWLDDRHLPCIPPVQITIPADYPNSSPKCDMSSYEYGATKFLQMIQEAFQSHISKLPSKYSMSQLLDTWEYSVRETCSTERIAGLDSVILVS